MGKPRVLVVDPDARTLALTASALARDDFEPATASCGEDALALVPTNPTLVFAEVNLPGVDGFELCRNLRLNPTLKQTPVFLLARQDAPGQAQAALSAGADDYLVKPLYAKDLCTLARLYTGRRSGEPVLGGQLDDTPLFYVLRAVTSGHRSGVIEVPDGGRVAFREGKIIQASAEPLVDEEALSRLLVLSSGPFTLQVKPVLLRASMAWSLKELVSFDEPRRQRFERAVRLLGGRNAKLAIDFPALTRELARLPASIERIVRLFDGRRSLDEVLRTSDLEPTIVAETVLRLTLLKVLRPVAEFTPVAPAHVPQLFEPRNEEAVEDLRSLFSSEDPSFETASGAPPEVRDWFASLCQRDVAQLISSATGGWVAVSAQEAGRRLEPVLRNEVESELSQRIASLDRAPSEPASADAPSTPSDVNQGPGPRRG